jgi:hypothetical protein
MLQSFLVGFGTYPQDGGDFVVVLDSHWALRGAGDGQFWKLQEEIPQPNAVLEWKRGSDTIMEVSGGVE